jgi:hypothetical protein
MKRATLRVSAVLAVAALVLASCSSSTPKKSDPGLGIRVLDCVVESREHESASSTSYRGGGTGDYYMTFVTREGQATSRYRLPVTRQQYQRFQEGDRVRITLNNNILTNIQPAD